MARISCPPARRLLAQIVGHAPAAHESSTSLTEQPKAFADALTSSSGSGSLQATTLRPTGLPLSRVGRVVGISASAARSLHHLQRWLARDLERQFARRTRQARRARAPRRLPDAPAP